MKKMTLTALLATLVSIHAPLNAADAAAGASAYASRACIGCHGAAGKKPIANYPAIGGKPADFIAGELKKFRSGERKNPIMAPMAAGLSDADIANLAAYLAAQ